jgi:hypothetical protein
METFELYNGKVKLQFEPNKHKYTVTVGGKTFKPVSVTGVTGIVDKSGPLIGWATNNVVNYIRDTVKPDRPYSETELEQILATAKKQSYYKKKEAANIGTDTHKWLELYFSGKNPQLPGESEHHRQAVEAALKWVEQHKVEFLFNEQPIYSVKYKFSGRMDGIASVDNTPTLVDFKSGNNIYDEAWLQTAAYNFAWEEEHKGAPEIDQRLVIRLGKTDGHFYSQIKNRKSLKPDWNGFLGALKLYTRLSEIKKESKELDTSKTWLDE